MRSPSRIPPFLRALQAVWEANPDMRFGQLVMNLSREDGGFADTWNWENGEWLRRMDAYYNGQPVPEYRRADMSDGNEHERESDRDFSIGCLAVLLFLWMQAALFVWMVTHP